jgi:hypothetical protein
MGWKPADNSRHKIINCPVPGCPMAGKTEAVSKKGLIGYMEFVI